jgi:ABC-type sugar transport system ATPase subunit
MASLTLDNVVKQYGRVTAVHRMSLSVADGEFLALLGPSGCGKTSTMRMIAGLEDISDGEVRIDGKVVNRLEPAQRQIAMSFEHYGLYPHLTLFGNVAYPLTVRGVAERDVKRQVFDIATVLHIEDILGSFPTTRPAAGARPPWRSRRRVRGAGSVRPRAHRARSRRGWRAAPDWRP